ncbi:PrgI family protein [Actinomadura rupiterrae]|uniref:PrgI family protein n=1 Tax=Actinomadura rupiterrae TaxID=559627 RepID=UPI0020A43B53|nr:PrgI family protein [Actinomadura rupiterrae]MCP2342001.1 hypothetical protein [Actinomadura rupiterrae]
MTRLADDEPLTARIPADVDQPDKILYNLNARQLAILAVTGLVCALEYAALHAIMPLPVLAAALFPVVALGAVLTVARRDGMSLDRFALAALLHTRSPKQQVAAETPVEAPPAWCGMRGELPAPLKLPVRAVRDDGALELANGGTAVLVHASTVAFALRSTAEQAALVAAFGRWLNSLNAPVQILVQARPVELSGLAEQVNHAAPTLPDPALEQAAHDHASFLTQVEGSYGLLGRRVLIVLRDHALSAGAGLPWRRERVRIATRQAAAELLLRRASETVHHLAGLGLTARVLNAAQATNVLTESLSSGDQPLTGLADPADIITATEGEPS